MPQLTYAEWIERVARILTESKVMTVDDDPPEIWQDRYNQNIRPSKAAAIAIDSHLAALRFKHI